MCSLESFTEFDVKGSKVRCYHEKNRPSLTLPPWFDRKRFDNSRSIMNEYFMSIFLGHLSGLVLLVYIKSIFRTLSLTGKSKDLVSIFYRYMHTTLHVKLWYEGVIYDPNDPAYHSLLRVKQMHQSVSDIQNRDVEPNQPVAMSQRDMTLTQFAFIGLIVMYPKEMGFSSRTEDLDRLIYFWRCIGYMLGIDDEYNLCEDNYQTVRTNCEQIFKHKFIPSLLEMKPESDEMSERIIISASHYIVLLRHRGLLRYLFEVANLNIPVVLDQSENLFYITLKWTMSTLIHKRFFAIILNNLLRFALYQLTFKRFVNLVVKSLEQFYDEK